GLWEFAHLLTGEPAERGEDDQLVLKENTGLVFVLLPGARLPIEDAAESRSLNEVDLVSFLLSKYEMTVAQWSRISSGWTTRHEYEAQPLHAASSVSWDDCQTYLSALPGWVGLPSEAQWEYGCRAGTTTPWWPGSDEALLHGVANIDFNPDDRKNGELFGVGTLEANAFGLHDVHGNLWEWCQDSPDEDLPRRPRDGLRVEIGSAYRVYRGGSFVNTASSARSAYRDYGAPEPRRFGIGLRPSQGITP
ncbi:MAG: formylglycine-generating enzyme family protein, partial [Planctomycetota bacterium]